jgi:hypothetical protein
MSEPHEDGHAGETTRAETDKTQQRLTPAMVVAIAAKLQGDVSGPNAHESLNDTVVTADVVSDEFDATAGEGDIVTDRAADFSHGSNMNRSGVADR